MSTAEGANLGPEFDTRMQGLRDQVAQIEDGGPLLQQIDAIADAFGGMADALAAYDVGGRPAGTR
jgi:hypothetical protein